MVSKKIFSFYQETIVVEGLAPPGELKGSMAL